MDSAKKPLNSLMVAPNGARKLKSDHPAVPISIDEIVDTAAKCFFAGADSLHLHVRKADGRHSLDPVLYREAMDEVGRAVPDMPIQITTESAGIFDVETQFATLQDVIPKAASVSVREIARDEMLASKVYGFCAETDIDVQHILYGSDDFQLLEEWRGDGTVPKKLNSVIFVLGQYQPAALAQPEDLQRFLSLPFAKDYKWAMCAFGQNELACAKYALALGGDIRIGFENNLHRPDGTMAQDNAELVTLAHSLRKRTKT